MDGEEDEEKGVVINMVVKEDDGQCKVLLSGGLCKFFPHVGAGSAAMFTRY